MRGQARTTRRPSASRGGPAPSTRPWATATRSGRARRCGPDRAARREPRRARWPAPSPRRRGGGQAQPASPSEHGTGSDRGRPPQSGHPGAGRCGDDVGLDEVAARDDVRQRRGEPASTNRLTRRPPARRGTAAHPRQPDVDDQRDDERQAPPHEGWRRAARGGGPTGRAARRRTVPPAIRQQDDGEPGGDGERVGLALRVEQDRPQRGLEHAVAPLRGEADRQQPPETLLPEQSRPAQPLGTRHRRRSRRGRRRFLGRRVGSTRLLRLRQDDHGTGTPVGPVAGRGCDDGRGGRPLCDPGGPGHAARGGAGAARPELPSHRRLPHRAPRAGQPGRGAQPAERGRAARRAAGLGAAVVAAAVGVRRRPGRRQDRRCASPPSAPGTAPTGSRGWSR